MNKGSPDEVIPAQTCESKMYPFYEQSNSLFFSMEMYRIFRHLSASACDPLKTTATQHLSYEMQKVLETAILIENSL